MPAQSGIHCKPPPQQKRAVQKLPLSAGTARSAGPQQPQSLFIANDKHYTKTENTDNPTLRHTGAGRYPLCFSPPYHVIPWLDHGTQVYPFSYFDTKQKNNKYKTCHPVA